MSEWFEFALFSIQKIVEMVFSLDLGLGFSLGDFEVALLLIGIVATALVVKVSHTGVRHDFSFGSGSAKSDTND